MGIITVLWSVVNTYYKRFAGEVVYEVGVNRRDAVQKLAGQLSSLLKASTVDATQVETH